MPRASPHPRLRARPDRRTHRPAERARTRRGHSPSTNAPRPAPFSPSAARTGASKTWVGLLSLHAVFRVFIVRALWTASTSRACTAFTVRFQEFSSALGSFFILFRFCSFSARDPCEDACDALTAALELVLGPGTALCSSPGHERSPSGLVLDYQQ